MRTRGRKAAPARLRADITGALLATLVLWAGVPPDAPVADAAMRGDADAVRSLVREGADVNASYGDGMTALHWAAELGSVEIARVLLAAGANTESITRLGDYTALHLAGKHGHADVVRALAEAGARVDASTSTGGAQPLHLAAASGDVEAVSVLLEHGAAVDAREGAWGQTPLMFAASSGRVEVARLLVAHGADVSLTSRVVDIPGRSSRDRAAGAIRDQVLASFRGDQPPGTSWQPTPTEVEAAVRAANEAWEAGAAGAEAAAAEADASIDLDLGQYDNSYAGLVGAQGGLSALLHAVREGEAETAFSLLEAGAELDQPSEGDHTTPLLMATINGHYDLALDLLARGADPNIASDAGAAPLFAALNTYWAPKARYPQQQAYRQQAATHLEVMRALLEAGGDPNARLTKHLWYLEYTFTQLDVDMRGATPFWRAAYALDLPAMQLLVEHGADPTIATRKAPARRFGNRGGGEGEDPSGLPPVPTGGPDVHPIHAATGHAYGTGFAGVSHRHAPDAWLPVVRYLVEEHGADVNARDANGFTPLHWAASRGDNEVIRYLVEQGADVMAVARSGQTTVDMANGPVQRITPFPEAIELLEGLGAVNNHNCVSC